MSDNTTNKAWGGRFQNGLCAEAAAFTDSESFDRLLYRQDIRGSRAHARMLGVQGIIPEADVKKILAGLDRIEEEIEKGEFIWRSELEDVHMNIEGRLIELIGEAGKKLHTGRSRNDQVGLTFRLFVADACATWLKNAYRLCEVLWEKANANRDVIMPGLTHFQPAQPISLAQHLLAYANMFKRDAERVIQTLERIRISPLGAAALAGSPFPLDPVQVALDVDFPRIYTNSIDAVSDRDFVVEAIFDGCEIMMHLSRLCEELILWSNPAFSFVILPDAYATGSSIMPQKKNPDVAELIRGKTGRVYGHLVGMLTVMKGLPLAYNRDLQEDKEAFLDTDNTVAKSLQIMSGMLTELEFQVEPMAEACKKGYLNATELADYLTKKGVPFREAHHITGNAVAWAEKNGKNLEDLTLMELQRLDSRIGQDVFKALDYAAAVSRRETYGGTGPKSVKRQLEDMKQWIETMKESF